MRVRLIGDDGRPVLKIAGLVSGVWMYEEEMTAAASSGYRIAALDTTGDRADDPASQPFSWDTLALETVAAIDRLGADRAVLWGTSFGCLIALATAARYPERVRGLLLAFPPEPGARPRLYDAILRRCQRAQNPDRAVAIAFRIGFALLTGWELAAPAALVRLPRLLRTALDAATPPSTIRRKLELLWQDDPGSPVSVPSSIISARLDPVAPLAGARRLAARLPGANLQILQFGGHACAYSRPRAYGRIALAELDRLYAPAQSRSSENWVSASRSAQEA